MRRDMDLIRQIMLKIEAFEGHKIQHFKDLELNELSDYIIIGHLALLTDAGLVFNYSDKPRSNVVKRGPFSPLPETGYRLTWQGHEFLTDIKDKDVWEYTKDASKRVGAESLDFLWQAARGFIRFKANEIGLPGF